MRSEVWNKVKRINLIPEEARRITPRKWLGRHLLRSRVFRGVAIAVAALIGINLWQASSLLRYEFAIKSGRERAAEMERELAAATDAYAGMERKRREIEAEAGRVEEKFRLLNRAREGGIAWAEALAALSVLVPEDLWINKMTLNRELITVVGTTFDNAIVSRFMSDLDASGYFRGTSFNYTQKEEPRGKSVLNFEVTTHIVPEEAAR